MNTANIHRIGAHTNAGFYFDGYLTEINFIDGQALTPSSFGATSTTTGVWGPTKYTGTYGTNGFYLNFSDNSNNTATTIGKDSSGNGNNWTPNNISVTTGATYDSMVDTPIPYGSDTGAGGEVRGNYAVLNPLALGSTVTLSNGNLTMTEVGTYATTVSTIAMTSGKWYAEMTVGSNTYGGTIGIAKLGYAPTSRLGFQANTWSYNNDGGLYYNSLTLAMVSSYTTGDVIGIAFDATNLTISFYKNNTLQTTQYTSANSGLTAGEFYFATGHINSTSNWNFGQRAFSYTAPSGYQALCTQNITTPTIANGAGYMAATLYTGTGSSRTIANTIGSASFQPDFVWVKGRSGATDHALYDSVRGVQKQLESNTTTAETTETTGLTAFGSTGFTVGALAQMNTNTATYVGWQWLAGAGSSSSNTDGNRTSTVSVNQTAGFSVVTWTFSTSATNTIGHGLGVAPSFIIVKDRSAAVNWDVYHVSLGYTQRLILNSTGGAVAGYFAAAPTSTVFSMTTAAYTNNDNIVAYCFAAIAGYSAFGSYTGNGSTDGPFVFTGFRPRFIMIKRTDSADDWIMMDSSRSTYNVAILTLYANGNYAEDSNVTNRAEDFLSNGFKIRSSPVYINASGGTYVYAAFAENPFKYALAR